MEAELAKIIKDFQYLKPEQRLNLKEYAESGLPIATGADWIRNGFG